MNVYEARQILAGAIADRREARTVLVEAEATLESSRLIIQGILRRFPELAEDAQQDAGADAWGGEPVPPKGAEAVLKVLQVNENKMFSVADMVKALTERGWLPESEDPSNAVRTALERLLNSRTPGVKKFRRAGAVLYRFNEPEPPKEEPAAT
jgi:hypothetical protein